MNFDIIFKFTIFLIPYMNALNPLLLTKPVTDRFGVYIHFTQPKAGEMQMISDAGFKWVRMEFVWGRTELKKGEYNFTEYETLINELKKHNMSALFILDFGNTLYDAKMAVITEVGHMPSGRPQLLTI
jgi:hypothetical protein